MRLLGPQSVVKVYAPCLGCGSAMRNREDGPQPGTRRYGGHGLCEACYQRRRGRAAERGDDNAYGSPPRRAPDWMADALCAQVDGDLFFPEETQNAPEARAVCKLCTVRPECLQLSLEHGDHGEPFGIWGMTNSDERRELRKKAS